MPDIELVSRQARSLKSDKSRRIALLSPVGCKVTRTYRADILPQISYVKECIE